MSNRSKNIIRDFFMMTIASFIMVVGVYYFKFPNHFSFGGVSGLSVVLGELFDFTPSYFNMAINLGLLVVGFFFFGKSFGIKTTYVSILVAIGPSILERIHPIETPLTTEPVLELIFAIFLPAVSSAVFFNMGASSGGTDIIAMIVRKYSRVDIGTALILSDVLIVIASCFIFNIQIGLFSFVGLLAKSLVVDRTIENLNLAKYFTIICDDPEPIQDFIINELHRSATVYDATGAYDHKQKAVILTIMKNAQAIELKNYIKKNHPGTFIAVTNSSEIIGKGFRAFN